MKHWLGIAAAACIVATPAAADVAVSGEFKAAQACPALQSIRNGTNPGDVRLEPGRSYPLISKNKAEATHYRVAVAGAEPRERWVEVGCGEAVIADRGGGDGRSGGDGTDLLVMSWEPAFCQSHGNKPECQRETEQSPDASQFSLHGLWPQPNGTFWCGVDRALVAADKQSRWWDLPEPALGPDTKARLDAVMPGTLSALERHEWIKHGTCFGGEADAYFKRAVTLTEAVNSSAARKLFAARIGKTVSTEEIRAAFDESFGAGAGERVQVHCVGDGEEREIGELFINLAGDVGGAAPLADLIRAAPTLAPQCPGGKVAEAAR